MYGWLLESVQHFIVQECGEELWETILQDAGARNTVFSPRQQYPDTLMLRLANILASLVSDNPDNARVDTPESPVQSKLSFKSRPGWRSVSANVDGRSNKCPFSATNALTAVTKKEIEAYTSSEEIRNNSVSKDKINEDEELNISQLIERRRMSFNPKVEDNITSTEKKSLIPCENKLKDSESVSLVSESKRNSISKTSEPNSPVSEGKRNSISKSVSRKNSGSATVIDMNRRRGSGAPIRPRLNSLNISCANNLSQMKEKFGSSDKVMHFFGRCFVKFFSNYGYDTMIRATGRYFCTFLQSVDSIHQHMRFTYPKMRSPNMQLTRAHANGAELRYSSTRVGFTHYLMGQLYEIAESYFSLKLKVSIVKENMEGADYVAVLRLEFDNNDYVQSLMMRKSTKCPLSPVPATLLLQLFPFGVLLDRKMRILKAGDKLIEAWGGPYQDLQKMNISDLLRLSKPKVDFTWDKVVCMQTMLFELELMRHSGRRAEDPRRGSQGARSILLKGPIHLLEEIDALVFLCSPIFNDLKELQQAGLYLADMNGHGLSKEMLLDSWQHLSRLELLFEKAESRSVSLEKSYILRDQWKKRGDKLVYSMIPKPVADQLRAGKDWEETCQSFESVTIMFCGLQLAELQTGTRADVMATVAYLNDVYSKIDRLLDSYRVYKVETVGTVYMVVSGAPYKRRAHAAAAASAALAICQTIPRLTIGAHSGQCVAGVLGRRVPRYCMVGDTVNTASRMQTTSEPGRIQISAKTSALLPAGKFRLRRRGLIKVKGKGMMETFWLEGEVEEDDQYEALQLFSTFCDDNLFLEDNDVKT